MGSVEGEWVAADCHRALSDCCSISQRHVAVRMPLCAADHALKLQAVACLLWLVRSKMARFDHGSPGSVVLNARCSCSVCDD